VTGFCVSYGELSGFIIAVCLFTASSTITYKIKYLFWYGSNYGKITLNISKGNRL
jgi:hypothetical protein